MDTLSIEANYRSDMSKSRTKQLRREGYVTGSVFGHDSEPVSVEVKAEDLFKQIKESDAGAKSLIELKIKGAPKKSDGIVIIKEFQKDPLTRKLLDLQFQRVNLKEKIHVGVPIELIGEPVGTKGGGMLEQIIYELQISCLPTDIPPRIEIDVSQLGMGHLIRVEELKIEGDVEILDAPDAVVCNCRPPHVVAGEAAEGAVEEAVPEAEGGPVAESTESEG